MFVDASAIVAILAREPGSEDIERRLTASTAPCYVSPLVKFEASMALARIKSRGARPASDDIRRAALIVDVFIEDLGAEQIAITPEIGRRAIEAAAVYGKVVGHAADLNFGDCLAYACAKTLNAPLLYKGSDFAETDLA